MILSLLPLTLALGLAVWVLRRRYLPAQARYGEPAKDAEERLGTLFGMVAIATAQWPWIDAMPALLSRGLPLGEGLSHAAVAAELADGGFGIGWISRFAGGFPLGQNYPPLGWALAGGLVELGLDAPRAVELLGAGAVLLAPWIAWWTARRLGLEAPAAALGAVAMVLVLPNTPYVFGWDAQLHHGFLAQSVSAPLLGMLVLSVARPVHRWFPPSFGALAAIAHPEIALPAFLLLGAAVLLHGDAASRQRYLRAGIAGFVAAAVVFGPGIASMGVPFGWSPAAQELRFGFSLSELAAFFERGVLLDEGRAPWLTSLALFGLVFVLSVRRSPAGRMVKAALLCFFLLLASGPALAEVGGVGAVVVSLLQPLRSLALLPWLVGAIVAVGLHEAMALFEGIAPERWPLRRGLRIVSWVALGALISTTQPSMNHTVEAARTLREEAANRCDEHLDGLPLAAIARRLEVLRPGRIEVFGEVAECVRDRFLLFRSSRAFGRSDGAGKQVAVTMAAFASLEPGAPNAAARAEALGVRAVLHDDAVVPGEGFVNVDGWRDLSLGVREGPGFVDVVCPEERWTGSDEAIANALFEDFAGEGRTLDPRHPPRIDSSFGALEVTPLEGCMDARVERERGRAGYLRATVVTEEPAEVVLRVTPSPSWEILVDGAPVEPNLVGPGFLSVPVPPGRHVVRAEAGWPWWYVLLGLLVFFVIYQLAVRVRELPPVRAIPREVGKRIKELPGRISRL